MSPYATDSRRRVIGLESGGITSRCVQESVRGTSRWFFSVLSCLLLCSTPSATAVNAKSEAARNAAVHRAAQPPLIILPEAQQAKVHLFGESSNSDRRARTVPPAFQTYSEEDHTEPFRTDVPLKTVRRNRFRRIATPLAVLVEQYLAGKTAGEIERFADMRGMSVSNGRVRVLLRAIGDSTAIDPGRLAAVGTEVKRSRSYVMVEVPLEAVPALEQIPGVSRVDIPRRFRRLAYTSEGTALTNALSFINAGVSGHGQSVAVVDLDFGNRIAAQLQGELPDLLYYQAFGAQPSGGDSHGTACAEIVYDMAPGASLHLLLINDILDMENARDYCIAHAIPVVSMSLGLMTDNFCDGTGEACDIVNAARAAGILWVTAAGNEADGHWMGPFLDGDGNRWTTFNTNGTERLHVTSPGAGYYLDVTLTWNDFPYTDQDYDLYLFNSAGNIVARSDFYQNGNDSPVEEISYPVPMAGGSPYYSVGVRRASGSRPMDLRIFVNTSLRNAGDRVSARSLSAPADAAGAFTVGAIDYRRYNSESGLETFSSRGPTYDGRIKPDITAPDYTSGYTFGPDGFPGTSAATPHVAGAAAVLRSLDPTASAGDLAGLLERFAVDMGTTAGKDTLFGAGRLRLPYRLEESVTLQAGIPHGYFLYGSSLPFWSAVAIHSTGTVQRSVTLYDSIRATVPIVAAAPSTAPVIFVQDLNRSSRPYFLVATSAPSTAVTPYLVHWSYRRLLTLDSPSREPFRPWEIVRMHDVFLYAGETYRLSITAETDTVLALYDSAARDEFTVTADGAVVSTSSAGMIESSCTFSCVRSDYYGVLVWRRALSASTDTLQVSVVRASPGILGGFVLGVVTAAVDGAPLAGVSVDVLDQGNTRIAGTRTADDGSYAVAVPTGTWTIRWSAPGYRTESTTTTVAPGSTVTVSAVLHPVGPFKISGRLQAPGGAGIADVAILLDGDSTGTFISRANGYYEFTGLASGSYTVTPVSLSYIFAPRSRSYTPLTTNRADQDFSGSPVHYLRGAVRDPMGAPVRGVSVTLTGTAERTTVTGADGTYTFGELATGYYTVTPRLDGWFFDPPYYRYAPLTAAKSDQHFTAVRIETDVGEVKVTGGSRGFLRAGDVLRIAYRPYTAGWVRIRVATLRGSTVWEHTQYCSAEFPCGVTWSGSTTAEERAPSGVYLVVVNGGGLNVVRRVALVR